MAPADDSPSPPASTRDVQAGPAPDLADLAARLGRLEQQAAGLRRQRAWLSVTLVLSLLVSLAAAGVAAYALTHPPEAKPAEKADAGEKVPPAPPPPKADPLAPVRTRRLVVVDEAGTARLTLGVDDAWPLDEDAKKKGEKNGLGLYARDEKGRPRLALLASEKGGAIFHMLDAAGKPAMLLACSPERQVVFGFLDPRGVTRGMLGLGKDEKPLLILRGNQASVAINDLAGTTRALLSTFGDGEGGLVIQDRAGKAITQVP
jgi:hypothetical protein